MGNMHRNAMWQESAIKNSECNCRVTLLGPLTIASKDITCKPDRPVEANRGSTGAYLDSWKERLLY